ncbi:MAG: fused MFS/spermidine synthase [Proteobacteria bacterium]|nr:fused MFS/spermidine synthase [Pseudomonadota bacterium]
MKANQQFHLALFLFFGSGCCALSYETVWVRQLTLSFGISVYAVSAVLSAYMFGLCVGAYVVGRLAHRIVNPLRIFAYFELGIVTYTFLLYFILADFTPALYGVVHGLLPDDRAVLTLAKFAAAFVLLALPTALMGGTLPVLSVFLRSSRREIGAGVGRLYGINTLGGAAGTALAGFWLIKDFGIFATTAATLTFNLVIVITALWFSRREERAEAATASTPLQPARPAGAAASAETAPGAGGATGQAWPPGSGLVVLVLLLSGYTALSYEVMWNRTLLLYIHNSTYAFSTILIVFLFGTSVGSLLYGLLPRRWTGMRTLGAAQILLGLFVWLSIPLTGKLHSILGEVTSVVGEDSWLAAMTTIVVSSVTVVLAPTILSGFTFPAATSLLASKREHEGSIIGRAYALLTIGNILGPIVTGFLLIEWLGLRNAFAIGICANLAGGCALMVYRQGAYLRQAASVAGVAAALVLFLNTVDRDIFRSYYQAFLPPIIFYKEEVTDNVLVWERPGGIRGIHYSDGRGTAGTFTEFPNRLYGHIPMLLHREPRSVLSICFGVGNTLSALAQYEPDNLTCVELSPGAIEAAGLFPSNANVMSTPNLRVHVDDGRNFLLRSKKRFDVIQLEPPELHQAGVVNLYTREFYELARDRLHEDGVICQWVSTFVPEHEIKMVVRTFMEVFPESSLWSGVIGPLLLVGSPSPLRVQPEGLLARANRPNVRRDLGRFGVSAFDVMANHLMGPSSLARFAGEVPLITDDMTYIDFSIPRSRMSGFGVFMYNTHQKMESNDALGQEVQRNSLRLYSQGESPEYLFDFSRTDAQTRASFVERLEASVVRHRNFRGVQYHWALATWLIAEGRLDEAIASHRTSLRLDPDQAHVEFALAQLLLQQGNVEGSRTHFERVLQIDPAHGPARAQLQRLELPPTQARPAPAPGG